MADRAGSFVPVRDRPCVPGSSRRRHAGRETGPGQPQRRSGGGRATVPSGRRTRSPDGSLHEENTVNLRTVLTLAASSTALSFAPNAFGQEAADEADNAD